MAIDAVPQGVVAPLLDQIAFYALCIWPAAAILAKPFGKDKNAKLQRALVVILLAAGAKLYLALEARETNYYELFGTERGSSALQIRKAFKKIKLQHSGVENPLPPYYQPAYNALMDVNTRHLYDKFGPGGVESGLSDEQSVLYFLGFFYAVWLMVTMLATSSSALYTARNYGIVTLIGLTVLEVATAFEQEPTMPAWLLPMWTEFEVRELLKSLYPVVLGVLQAWCWSQHTDVMRQGAVLTHEMVTTHYRRKLSHLKEIDAKAQKLERGEYDDDDADAAAAEEAGAGSMEDGDEPQPQTFPLTHRRSDRWHLYAAIAAYAAAYTAMKRMA
mmetsp:Transcript_41857/g.131213  ORF Transcript_41857/g.131213 Transcript_41857/m.131213 type:complete len:331 (-) Transcript_41857:26-1018(-)|eukprot:CAMPEP_0118851454 /NCGR_PEP_ID=MMETSP1163-20130328/898_1 /TAXON_ID=124430 /ORGANISM="Phaeomonas parva, Strain CCMP2877" /LENGTH=330 /DNA_ID=CAMNT_0006783801 /DNA_START=326 /DNA_END=1318 /DNA_ORIENTATION=-